MSGVLGILATLAAALSLAMFLRARWLSERVYWLASAIVAAGIFVAWVLFG